MKPFSYLLLIAVWALLSCEEPAEPTYPITFSKGSMFPTGFFRVFTVNGEITSSTTINKFMVRDTGYFNSMALNLSSPNRADRLRFTNNSDVIVTMNYLRFECTVVDTLATRLLKRKVIATPQTYGKQMKRSYPYMLGNVKPEILSEYLISSTRGGYVFGYRTREFFVLNGNRAMYSMPIVLYAGGHQVTPYGSSAQAGYINNTLQPDFYTQLSEQDTVTVMEYVILFLRE